MKFLIHLTLTDMKRVPIFGYFIILPFAVCNNIVKLYCVHTTMHMEAKRKSGKLSPCSHFKCLSFITYYY